MCHQELCLCCVLLLQAPLQPNSSSFLTSVSVRVSHLWSPPPAHGERHHLSIPVFTLGHVEPLEMSQ